MLSTTQFRSRHSRSGVTLLMVVSIIVLFLLMGAAFLVLATQFRRSATMLSHVRERRDDARTLVKRAFQDLLREPSLDNARSPLRGHSLLGDLYGYGFTRTGIPAAALNNEGQGIWSITLQAPYDQLTSDLEGSAVSPFPNNGSFNGRYLSITDVYAGGLKLGETPGLTGIIFNYEVLPAAPPAGNRYRFFVRFGWDDAALLPAGLFDTFDLHINGRPFTGSGAGRYTAPTSSVTNFRQPALTEDALRPNRTGEGRTQLINNYLSLTAGGTTSPNFRSTNEDYDAVDFQNMFLGAVRTQSSGAPQITPSFYRPELVRYWGQSGLYDVNTSLGQLPYSFHADLHDGLGAPLYRDTNRNGIPDRNEQTGTVIWDVDNDGDGINDSIWMDIDLPIQTDIKGKVYKPLVAYHVLDMDGRLNVNFHGNPYQRDPANLNPLTDAARRFLTPFGLYGDLNGLLHPTGIGLGTGEISLSYAFDQLTVSKLLLGFDGQVGRYGSDGQIPALGAVGTANGPGATGLLDYKSAARFQNYPNDTFANAGLVNYQLYRSPLDIHGRYDLGVPNYTLAVLRDPYDSSRGSLSIAPGMPIINAINSGLANELVDSVYEMDASQAPFTPRLGLAPNLVSAPPTLHGMDANYSPHELESVLRAFDFDSRQLPGRLRKFLPDLFTGSNSQLRHLLTTDSWELPVAPQLISDLFYERWGRAPTTDDLPTELFFGRKLNLNRRVNNPANPAVPVTDPFLPRHLFTLALLVCPEPIDYDYNADGSTDVNDQLAFRKDLAQWCVNVKDFIDPDSINTRFLFDLVPEDGWTPTVAIWGCERPELLLTESFALHDKRLEDLDSEASGTSTTDPMNPDDDLDSRYVPNASAFFEIYNPWFYGENPQTRLNSGLPPPELYNGSGTGVDLQRVVGGSPVWRLRVLNSSTNTNGNIDEDNIGDDSLDVVKIVYFAKPANSFLTARHSANPEVVFFPPASLRAAPPLEPGKRAIIGSAGVARNNIYTTFIGRLNSAAGAWNTPGALARTRKIVLDPDNLQVRTLYWDNAAASMREQIADKVVCIPIGEQFVVGGAGSKPRNFGLTDPKRGYDVEVAGVNPTYILNPVEDGYEFFDSSTMLPVTLDTPADKQFQPPRWAAIPTLPTLTGGGLRDEGKIMSCFAAHLQRLADPTQPFDPVNNPYLTVDYIGSDVSIINGIYAGNDPDRQTTLDDDLASFERGKFHERLGNQEPTGGQRTRILWKGTMDGSLTVGSAREAGGLDQHVVSRDVIQSFGELDLAYRRDGSSHAFPWLTWNNRPFASQLELHNVPYTPQALLTSRFDTWAPSLDNPYAGLSTRAGTGPDSAFPHAADRFNHLFNFFADSVTSGPLNARQGLPALHRLFDYLHVESQFAGASDRIPGKINLNTISDERVWLGLMQKYAEPGSPQNPYGTVTWQQFEQSRSGNIPDLPTAIPNLFRNADAVHRVPVPKLLTRTSSATLFRPRDYSLAGANTNSTPLFELSNNPGDWANPNRNAYFRYDIRQRLGNLVTNRSNVYAVWVTVGFFEIDPATGKPVAELGLEEGTVQRHRGFFLVDRSIPVAFQPGRDHDVENCVLVESIIQREVTSQK